MDERATTRDWSEKLQMDIRESIDETAAGLTAQIKSEYSEDLEMSLKG
jgi:hypothetical protein